MKHVVAFAKFSFFSVCGAAIAYVMWAGSNLRMEPNPNISEAEFIAIILTALGVILAALAIFLGGMALVSWRTFDDRVKAHAEDFLDKRFSPSDQRYADLVDMLRDDARREGQLAKRQYDNVENQSPFDENEL